MERVWTARAGRREDRWTGDGPGAAPRWRAGGLRAGLGMLLLFAFAQLVALVSASLAAALFAPGLFTSTSPGSTTELSAWSLLALVAVPVAAAGATAVVGVALSARGPAEGRVRRGLALRWDWSDVGAGLALGVGGLLLTVPAAWLWAAWVGEERAGSAVGAAFGGRSLEPGSAVAVFLVVWLLAPVVEEVLFRGVLWRALEHWRWNRWLIFAVTSAVFAVAHLEWARTPLLLVLAIPIGLARVLTGNLLASVVAHQVNNFLPALVLLLDVLDVLP